MPLIRSIGSSAKTFTPIIWRMVALRLFGVGEGGGGSNEGAAAGTGGASGMVAVAVAGGGLAAASRVPYTTISKMLEGASMCMVR